MQSQNTTLTIDTVRAEPDQPGWSALLRSWGSSARKVLPIFLGTRLLLLLLTYFGGILFKVDMDSTFALNLNSLFYNWYHWDAQRNITIASQGYIDPTYTTLFPLYPALLHIVSTLTHLDPLLAGMLISNLAYFAALVVLYRLFVRWQKNSEQSASDDTAQQGTDESSQRIALRSILYLTIFPTALFFFAAYNTSLLLFFSLLCLYLLQSRRWWLAGLCGALAALTDITGILLFVVFLFVLLQQRSYLREQSNLERWLAPVASLCIPVGLLIYALGLKKPFNDPFLFLHPQSGSDTVPVGAIATIQQVVKQNGWLTYAGVHTIFELLIVVFLVALLAYGWWNEWRGRKQQNATQSWPLWLYGLLVLLWGLISARQPGTLANQFDPFAAVQYAALLCFPAFLALARLSKHTWLHYGYLIGAVTLQAFLVFQMFSGLWAQ